MIQEITIKPSQTPNLCAVESNPSLFLNLSVMDFCFPGLERRTWCLSFAEWVSYVGMAFSFRGSFCRFHSANWLQQSSHLQTFP